MSAYSALEILCALAAVVLAFYYYFTLSFDFWKNQGVKGPEPVPVFGNLKNVMLGRISLGDFATKLYNEFKNEPIIGVFARRTPVVILTDPDLIRDVLIKDFSKFADRGLPVHERMEPLSQHLFSLEATRWRPLRTRLSPVFTSGKLKEMFHLIVESSEHLEKYLEKLVEKGEPIECRDFTAKFTTDVIGSCAFGIEMNSLSDEDSEFRKMGRKVFATDLVSVLKIRMREALPWLYDLFGFVVPHSKLTKFFTRIVAETMDYRKKNNFIRHDFIDILVDLEKHPEKLKDIKLTDTLLAAQAFVFFIAGFETSSTTISNALYELALNPDVQKKVRQEIKENCAKNDDDLKYENITQMSYLDGVFRETLRKYPPVTVLMRKSIADYTFEGTKVSIPKGTRIWIPAYAIQRDPTIYPNPDVFDPQRFSEDVVSTRHPMNYLPFGDGPRNCIGARFAVYQTKIGLIKILRHHKVEVCEKTPIPYVNHPRTFLLAPKEGIFLKITRADD